MLNLIRFVISIFFVLACTHASAQSSAGTTIIVHGFNSNSTGWVQTMANAVRLANGGNIRRATVVGSGANVSVAFDQPLYSDTESTALGPNGSGNLILVVDWSEIDAFGSELSGSPNYPTQLIANALDTAIIERHSRFYEGPIHLTQISH